MDASAWHRPDLEEFYELVAVGDTVELVGERNEETARLFGEPEKPASVPATEPVLIAMVHAGYGAGISDCAGRRTLTQRSRRIHGFNC